VINTGGCLAEFEALIIKNIAAVGGVGVGIALIQVKNFFSPNKLECLYRARLLGQKSYRIISSKIE
jgi:hypothetical protein